MSAKVSEIENIKKDIASLAAAVNRQAVLLNAIVNASDYIVKQYLNVIKVEEPNGVQKAEEKK